MWRSSVQACIVMTILGVQTNLAQAALFGFNAHPGWSIFTPDEASATRQMQTSADYGATVMRLNLAWTSFEWPYPGAASWYPLAVTIADAEIDALKARNVAIIGAVSGAPCWASADPAKNCSSPTGNYAYDRAYPATSPGEYARFVGDLVRRYKGKVNYWEIWNEPNFVQFWKVPNAAAYVDLLKAVYPVIKGIDPEALVVAGSVAPLNATDKLGVPLLDFIEQVYATGGAAYFDRLSVHAYAHGKAPDAYDPRFESLGFSAVIPLVRQKMIANGDQRPLLITESGYSTVTRISCGDCWIPGLGVSEQTQAAYTSEMIRVVRAWDFVEAFTLYELKDPDTPITIGIDSVWDHHGLFYNNLSPKPAAAAFKAATTTSAPIQVVEFYNAQLDHYFISSAAGEIAALDAGTTIKGWSRTGEVFAAFPVGQLAASPVCRFYIPPGSGDSHFFGRGTAECARTARDQPSFTRESDEVLGMMMPTAGVCRGTTIPVYRLFSNRADANHRYTTKREIRDDMVGRGWIAEGDGADFVVMCAPSQPKSN